MDDRNFDKNTAQQWIAAIEAAQASPRDNDIYPLLNRFLAENTIREVLEIGCGQGVCSDKINFVQHTYTGVDPSPILIARAKELYPDKEKKFAIGNVYSLPFADSSFDGSFSVAVWHLLGDLTKASHELSRILKPHGKFLIISANPDAYEIWKGFYREIKIEGNRLEGTMPLADGSETSDVLFLHTKNELLGALESAGLKIESTNTFRTNSKDSMSMYISIHGQKT